MTLYIVLHIPNTAACGKLMIGVPYNEPKTPPLELKKRDMFDQWVIWVVVTLLTW